MINIRHIHKIFENGGTEETEDLKLIVFGGMSENESLNIPKSKPSNFSYLLRFLRFSVFQKFCQLCLHPLLQHCHQTVLRLTAQPAASQDIFDQIHGQLRCKMNQTA